MPCDNPYNHFCEALKPVHEIGGTPLLPLRAFTTFAVQGRYDDDPEELNLDRTAWCLRAEALIEHVQNLLG